MSYSPSSGALRYWASDDVQGRSGMRQNRFNISTGVIEVNYPMTMTADDVQYFKDQMAITFWILERTATNGRRQEGETTSESNIADFGRGRNQQTLGA